jgi:hypothetical protein
LLTYDWSGATRKKPHFCGKRKNGPPRSRNLRRETSAYAYESGEEETCGSSPGLALEQFFLLREERFGIGRHRCHGLILVTRFTSKAPAFKNRRRLGHRKTPSQRPGRVPVVFSAEESRGDTLLLRWTVSRCDENQLGCGSDNYAHQIPTYRGLFRDVRGQQGPNQENELQKQKNWCYVDAQESSKIEHRERKPLRKPLIFDVIAKQERNAHDHGDNC